MNAKRILKIGWMALVLIALVACAPVTPTVIPTPTTPSGQEAGIANPASTYCTEKGNQLVIETAADGSQQGMCVFPDGSSCDEWAYYRGECSPAPVPPSPVKTLEPTPSADEAPATVVEAVRSQIASLVPGLDPATIQVLSAEPVEWPDACLGAGKPEESCLAVVTPGYRVTAQEGDAVYIFHTDATGQQIRQEIDGSQPQ